MSTHHMRPALMNLSDAMKSRIGDLLDEFRRDLSDEHQDLLQEISFKVGLLASVIVDGDLSAADAEREWQDCRARTAAHRSRRAEKQAAEPTVLALPVAAAATASPTGEEIYAAWQAKAHAVDPDSYIPASLSDALKMLDTWTADTFPAEANGQVHFGRAFLECAADAIRWDLALIRPEVRAFALLMERELRANEHKGGWQNEAVGALMASLFKQMQHLSDATHDLLQHGVGRVETNRAAVIENAADVGNFAMMVADVVGGLRQPPADGGAA